MDTDYSSACVVSPQSHSEAIRAIGKWTSGHPLPPLHPEILTMKDAQGNTILHSLAVAGIDAFFLALFHKGLLTNEMLVTPNLTGNTPLHEAARFGHLGVVHVILNREREMVRTRNRLNREREMVRTRNRLGETPLYVAAASGRKTVYDILKKIRVGREDLATRYDGWTILHAAVEGEYYKLALDILDSFPDLAEPRKHDDENKMTVLHILADKPVSFRSGSLYALRNMPTRPFVPLHFFICMLYLCIPVNESKLLDGDEAHPYQDEPAVRSQSKWDWVNKIFTGLFGFKGVVYAKHKHECALKLAKRLIEKEQDWNHFTHCAENTQTRNPLIKAVENGINEFVEAILKKFPEAAYTLDCRGKNVFHIAVEQKDQHMYEFLKKNVVSKQGMMTAVDKDGNTILHHAAAPNPKRGANSRFLLGQMAFNVYWLKLVCYDSPANFPSLVNRKGKTATELFEKNHRSLRGSAEKALKDMNQGLMVVATLVGTVNYAAILTLPGGFDTTEPKDRTTFGRPALYGTDSEGKLLGFLWDTGVALFAFLVALMTMVAIQLSKFLTGDFFLALPSAFIIALSALYVSVLYTIAAAFDAYNSLNVKFTTAFATTVFNNFAGPLMAVAVTLVYIEAVALTGCYLYFACRCFFSCKGQEIM